MPATKPLKLGSRFGKLVVHSKDNSQPGKGSMWYCLCDCGKFTSVKRRDLVSGHTSSCGCESRRGLEKRTKHGQSPRDYKAQNPLYTRWLNMKNRCRNPKCPEYRYYGGKGISVCKRWDESFLAFEADMGHPPSKAHTLERINSDRDYEPGNVVWAKQKQQMKNTSRTYKVTINGQTKCLKDWCRALELSYKAVQTRVERGWEPIEALTCRIRK